MGRGAAAPVVRHWLGPGRAWHVGASAALFGALSIGLALDGRPLSPAGPLRYAAPLVEQAPGGRVVSENLCQASCPDVNVRFEDVPLDSVWQVRRGSVDGHFVSGDT